MRCNLQHLRRRLALGVDDFRKTFAQRAMGVELRETEVGHGRGLEGAQHLLAGHAAGEKFLQKRSGFDRGHEGSVGRRAWCVKQGVRYVSRVASSIPRTSSAA